MNAPTIFAFDAAAVRVFMIHDAPWFVAGDIASILGYKHVPHMVRMLDEDERGTHIVDTLGGKQDVSVVNESGMFACVLKSRRPEAKTFRKWVTSEVLPSIRQHGTYTMPGAAEAVPEYSNPMSLNHRADIAVAADRTFRAMMRSGRTVGLPLPQALRRANEITLQKTGVDMLRELGAEDAILPRAPKFDDAYGVSRFFTAWMDGALPVPFTVCRSTHFYRAYELWAGENGIEPTPVNVFFAKAYSHRDRVKKGVVHGKKGMRAVIPVGAKVGVTSGEWSRHAENEIERFAAALKKWDKPDR
jgi:prophage antirepressor-like protein